MNPVQDAVNILSALLAREIKLLHGESTHPAHSADAMDDFLVNKRKTILELRALRTQLEDLAPELG